MIRFFKSPQPANMIIIPIIILAFWIRSANQVATSMASGLPLWDGIASFLTVIPAWLSFALLYILICTEAIYLNIMLNRHEVIYKNTTLPALIFALLISLTPAFMQIHPIHLVNLLLIKVFDRLFTLYKSEETISALFDSGFLAGIAALLFFPSLLLLPLMMVALVAMRPFKLKEWLIMIIGFALPFFFLSTYMFWIHALPAFWNEYSSNFNNMHSAIDITLTTSLTISMVFVGLLLLLSLLKLRSNYRKNIIRIRIYQQIFIIFLLLAAASLYIKNNLKLIDFLYLLIPFSVFCGYYFVTVKKRAYLYEYALWVLIGLIIWNQI